MSAAGTGAFDVVVIGAGIAGASVSAELARTHRVALLEREDLPGYHSTGRSAALFSESYGNAAVRALTRASREFLFSPPEGFSDHALVRPRGALHIAREDQRAGLDALAAHADMAAQLRRVTREEALGLCPVLRPESVFAAVLEEDAVDLDVDALHRGCLRRLKRAGGTLVLNAEVETLLRQGGIWHIETRERRFRAAVVVDAAGAWADIVAGRAGAAPLGIQPRRRTAVLVELPQGVDAARWPMVIDIDESFYMKPDAGLLLISPADETPVAPCDVQPEEIDIATGIDRAERATTLTIRRLRKSWAGLRSFAPDRSLVIGFDAKVPGFFWLAGQGGYGIQTAPAAARLAASLIRGETPEEELAQVQAELSPARFA